MRCDPWIDALIHAINSDWWANKTRSFLEWSKYPWMTNLHKWGATTVSGDISDFSMHLLGAVGGAENNNA